MMCCRFLFEMDGVRTNFGPFESASSAGLGTAMLPIAFVALRDCDVLVVAERERMALFALVEMFGVIRLHEAWCFSTRLWRSACNFFYFFLWFFPFRCQCGAVHCVCSGMGKISVVDQLVYAWSSCAG